MAGAAADVQNALASLGFEQIENPGRHFPDERMFFIVQSRIPRRTLRHVHAPASSSTAPPIVSKISLPFLPNRTVALAILAFETENVPEQSVFKYGSW